MMCQWKELLAVLPPRLREPVDRLGRDSLRELRLRRDCEPELNLGGESRFLSGPVTREELEYVINGASRYSPWRAETIARGYLTAPGGHRIGICGEGVVKNGKVTGIRTVDSLCIRIAADYPNIAEKAARCNGSLLILAPPGWGKTTLLRDLARLRAQRETVVVIDDRGELFPEGMERGKRMDVLRLCPKQEGIPMALRTMGPMCIAVDEITDQEDAEALLRAANCGVRLLATAHGETLKDLIDRTIYAQLLQNHVFDTLVRLRQDQSYTLERMEL